MVRVFLDGLDGSQIKVLGVHQRLYEPLFQKLTHGGCNSSQAQAHGDPSLLHDFSQRNRGGDGRSPHSRLIGKAVPEIGRVDDKLGAVVGHHQLSHICGGLGRSRGDLSRISNGIHHADIVHICHGNAGRNVWEGHQTVCNCHNLVRILGVHHGIGKHAAVALSPVWPAVSVLIAGGRADEGNVNVHLAGLNGPHTAAVGAHNRQISELSRRYGLSDFSPHAGGLNACHRPVLDVGHNRIIGLTHGAGADGDALYSHPVNLFHDHVQHIVAFTEMMVKGKCHIVTKPAFFQGLTDGVHHLRPLRI
ncbi:putative uncharacterized protein [Clostridium sp. CAG:149]|nr:putative uncharacterized protein [Clostridium sp. CAG:149]